MKRKPAWLKGHKIAPAGLVGGRSSSPPPNLGDSFCNITCGKCQHSADFAEFQHAVREREFRCPTCHHTWRIETGEVERVIELPGGRLAVRSKTVVTVEPRRQIIVPAERLQGDLWGLPKGDIAAAYTADQSPKIRKPFTHDGQLWANWGGSEKDYHCTPLLPLTVNPRPLPRPYSHTGQLVQWKGVEYVCGEEVDFLAAPRAPGSLLVLARRMFAYGGYFATKSGGGYRGMLREWIARDDAREAAIYAVDLEADLPQTQAGMRELLGGPRVAPEPPRFNPHTGKTT